MSIDLWDKLPSFFILAVTLWIYLLIETFLNQQKPWFFPALAVYFTIGMWYFTEIIYTPEGYLSMPPDIVQESYIQVIIFLITYRLSLPFFVRKLSARTFNTLPQFSLIAIRSEQILFILALIWFLILLWGLNRINWNFIAALFPLGSRSGSIGLFGRGALAKGAEDTIAVTFAYIYTFICSSFGIVLFFHKRNIDRFINVALISISWPMFLFSGTRNALLAVSVPCFLTYLIVSKQRIWIKILVTMLAFVVINYVMTVIIAFRNIGFDAYFHQILYGEQVRSLETQKQEGLNMAYELFHINMYLDQGLLSITYGYDYLIEALNFIPRGLWPDKPFIGLEYARLRAPGKGWLESLGIVATISRGLIGGGVMNFGPVLGPVAPALLMAIWSGVLARFWQQRYSLLRFALFLVGLGITPNLGRDFTLLVLWPVIFGYLLVLWIEQIERKRLHTLNFSRK